MKLTIERLSDFDRDMKKLLKKYRTLEEDLENCVKAQIIPLHRDDVDNGGTIRLPGLGFDDPPVYKVRKFASRSLKGKGNRTGIRVIYAFFEDEWRIELVEIYSKTQKAHENTDRIREQYRR